jgi:hypothetical protein
MPKKGQKMSQEQKTKIAVSCVGRPGSNGSGREPNTVDSVWRWVDKRGPDECWPWVRASKNLKTGTGHGRLDISGVPGVYAHRAAYLSTNPGSISLNVSDGMMVLHRCDNPPCCNPAHLYLGDHDQNMRDKRERKRCPDFRGARGPHAKLTEDDVTDIRLFTIAGATANAIALLFGVSRACIKDLRMGRTYRDIP